LVRLVFIFQLKTNSMKKYLALVIALVLGRCSFATHLAGAEIFYEQDSVNAFRFYVTVNFYKTLNPNLDLQPIYLNWGDGIIDTVYNEDTTYLALSYYVFTYRHNHTYAGLPPVGAKGYTISTTGLWRLGVSNNINEGNSENVACYVEAFISNHQLAGRVGNRSPRIVSLPKIRASMFVPHIDTLVMQGSETLFTKATVPLQDGANFVPVYKYPDELYPSPANLYTVDSAAHLLSWISPAYQGVYTVALKMNQYAGDTLLGYTMRDYPIFVQWGPAGMWEDEPEAVLRYSHSMLLVQIPAEQENVCVLLTDLSGRVRLRHALHNSATHIPVSDLERGVYVYALLQNGTAKQSGKVVIEP
jgi:hypothetical protein